MLVSKGNDNLWCKKKTFSEHRWLHQITVYNGNNDTGNEAHVYALQ